MRLREGRRVRDGRLIEGMIEDGVIVGFEMLRLGAGTVRDGSASDGIVTDGSAADRLVATDSIPTEGGKTCDGTWNPEAIPLPLAESAIPKDTKLDPGTLSTLFVGIPKTGSPVVGIAGKLIIGRPKESRLGAAVGSSPSTPGGGMEKGGGPVIEGNNPVESEVSGA